MFHKNLLRIKWLKLGIQTTEFAVRNARPIYSISQSITIHGICYRRRAHAVRHVSVGYKWFLFATLNLYERIKSACEDKFNFEFKNISCEEVLKINCVCKSPLFYLRFSKTTKLANKETIESLFKSYKSSCSVIVTKQSIKRNQIVYPPGLCTHGSSPVINSNFCYIIYSIQQGIDHRF